jgi:hypothetical protein
LRQLLRQCVIDFLEQAARRSERGGKGASHANYL